VSPPPEWAITSRDPRFFSFVRAAFSTLFPCLVPGFFRSVTALEDERLLARLAVHGIALFSRDLFRTSLTLDRADAKSTIGVIPRRDTLLSPHKKRESPSFCALQGRCWAI